MRRQHAVPAVAWVKERELGCGGDDEKDGGSEGQLGDETQRKGCKKRTWFPRDV